MCSTSFQSGRRSGLLIVRLPLELLDDRRRFMLGQEVWQLVERVLGIDPHVLAAHASGPRNPENGRELTGGDASVAVRRWRPVGRDVGLGVCGARWGRRAIAID